MKTRKIEMKNEVNRALRAKKRFLMLAWALICMLFVSEKTWAYSYYGALKVTASPDNQGVVYAAPSEEVTDENDEVVDYRPSAADYSAATAEYTGKSGDVGSGQPAYITAHAIPNQGYKFNGWTDLGGDGSPELYNCTVLDNPIQVKVTASTTDNGTNTATITANFITNPSPAWMVQYLTATNGSYTAVYNSPGATQPTIGGAAVTTYDNDKVTLTATPASGYVFYRFYGIDSDNNKYTLGDITTTPQTIVLPEGTIKVGAEFTNHALIAGESTYSNLKDALQALRKNDGTYEGLITLLQDYTVPAGYYTIPSGVTLLVPYKGGQTPKTIIERTFNVDYVKPSQYRKLTLASGVHMDVFGTIEAGCKQSAKGQSDAANGAPTGPYGHIYMESGSDMTIESGAVLRAWGFVTGDGTIDVRRGGEVHEQFQILDFKGGTNTKNMMTNRGTLTNPKNEGDVFPLNQYDIQNVEVKATYHPGAKLFCSTAWYMSISLSADDIQLVGVRNHKDGSADDVAMFLMDDEDDSDDTWIRKYYDRTTDRQMYEVNNSAAIGSFSITMSGYNFPTANFDLPITSNMTIHLLYGNMDLTQDAVLLAGAEIILDKQSTFIVPEGIKLYLYDQAEWDKFVFSGYYAQRVKYVPHLNDAPTARAEGRSTSVKPASAAIRVGGTMQIDGAIYTTEGGANITSTNEEAGTILFNKNGAPAVSSQVCQWKDKTYVYSTTPSAILRNEDTDHPTTTTAGTPSGQSYCYMNGKWTMMTVDPDNSCFVYDQDGIYYAKPDGYVAINAAKNTTTKVISGNEDHTFSDASGNGKLYILVDECQWWEVVNEDNLYHCQHPQNDTYYWWNSARMVDDKLNPGWEEKKFAISWKNYDGSAILDANNNPVVYYLPYGATPKYNSTNPTRPADVDYTYNFTGWSPAFTPVTGDQSYTATYSKEQIKYTIIFKFVDSYHSGAEIDRQLLARDEMPVIPTVSRAGWYLKWTPAVAAVTGNATYEADWMEELPDNYMVTWKNYDGTTLKTTTPARDATAETVLAGAPTATKPSTSEYRYEFSGWQPAVTAATADASYVAQFNEIAQTYAIRFYKEDGTTQIGTTQELTLGADPVIPAYSKENPMAGRTYKLKWINKATSTSVGVTVPSVSGAADYRAAFDETVNRYTITLNSKNENDVSVVGCNFNGAGTYDYGTKLTLTATPKEGFKFLRWSDGVTSASRSITVTQNSTYTAIVEELPSIILKAGETMTVSSPTEIYELVIKSNGENSSNLIGSNNISLNAAGHAYFDLLIYAQRRHWRAFTVPFEVDLKQHPILADGVSMPLGVQYDIVYYDGAVRAAQGKVPDCWKYVEDETDWILTPGKAYMIVFGRDVNTVRFTKREGASIAYTGTVSVAENNGASDDVNGGWNGIGNPATYHALLNAGVTTCQVHNGEEIGSDGYIACDMGKFIVGKAVYVQVAASQSVVVDQASSSDPQIAAVPRRAKTKATGENRFDVQIAPADGEMADRMFLLADEDKEDKYVILQDLAKAGVSTKRAQMWVNRYGTQLCKNTAQLIEGNAEYPLGIYAPQAGEYKISIAECLDEKSTLYLTLDGSPIWNLSNAPYIAELDKGTTKRYGLKMVRGNAPAITTAIDNVQTGTQPTAQKILLDGQVYILRSNNIYSVDGQIVK